MSVTTRRVRTIAPPVLGLGLALLVVRPLGADEQSPQYLPRTGSEVVTLSGDVGATVPAVVFTERISIVGGRIHTPVLVNVAEPGGTASVVGVAGCVAPAAPGVAVWLDCAYTGSSTSVTIAVTLQDGRRFTHTVAPTIS